MIFARLVARLVHKGLPDRRKPEPTNMLLRHNLDYQAKRSYGFAKHTLHEAATAVPRQVHYMWDWADHQKDRVWVRS